MKTFLSILLISFWAASAAAQDFSARVKDFLQSQPSRSAEQNAAELKNLRRNNRKLFTANNLDYLEGRIAQKRGDFATANASFAQVVKRGSILKSYALWHLAEIARADGNLLQERIYLQQISAFDADSLLTAAVERRSADSLFESGDFAGVIRAVSQTNAPEKNLLTQAQQLTGTINLKDAKVRERFILLGAAYEKSGKINEAREVFGKISNVLPNAGQPDDFALEAVRGLDRLDAQKAGDAGKIAPQIAYAEHYRRAQIYQFNRDFNDARLHFRALNERFPASPNAPFALLQIGRGFALENNFADALTVYEEVLRKFPEHAAAKDALNFKASSLARLNRTDEAVKTYREFFDKFVRADLEQPNAERPFFNIVDILRDANRPNEALTQLSEIRSVFKDKLPAALADFTEARIYLAQNRYQDALSLLDKLLTVNDLGGTRTAGGTNNAEIVFLRGLCLENLQRFAEAAETYLSLGDGRGEYYGFRATERLKMLGNNAASRDVITSKLDTFRQIARNSVESEPERARLAAQNALRLTDDDAIRTEMLAVARKVYAVLPSYQKIPQSEFLAVGRQNVLTNDAPEDFAGVEIHQKIADELLFLGLPDEGAPELEKAWLASGRIKSNQANLTAENYTLAILFARGNMAHRTVRLIEPLWKSVPADFLIELMPRQSAELLYPAPFADSLLRYAPQHGVDPRFLLSIMRQESRYDANVKSYAAARGLMQFISTTSDDLAKKLNRQNFRQNDLYNPATAIEFGAFYTANLFKMFPNEPSAVAASYNGGETNMERWLKRSAANEADRYVPEIIFSQSKDYVYKVMANYRVYRLLYDENLRLK